MPTLALLGRPVLAADDGVIVTGRPAQRHGLALLALLAGERQGVSRDRLLAYLWPEMGESAGRHRLSVTLHVLRRRLGAGCIVAAGDAVVLDAGRWRIDAWEFEDRSGRGDFEEAIRCCRGLLLDGFFLRGAPGFERWLERWRDRLGRRQLSVLEALAEEARRAGDLEGHVGWTREVVMRDPCSAGAVLALMRALAEGGKLEAALRSARAYALAVREELGLEPDPAVLDYGRSLARDRGPPSADGWEPRLPN